MHTAIYLFLFMGKNQRLFTSVTFVYKIDIMRLHFGGTCEQELLNSSLSSKMNIILPLEKKIMTLAMEKTAFSDLSADYANYVLNI